MLLITAHGKIILYTVKCLRGENFVLFADFHLELVYIKFGD